MIVNNNLMAANAANTLGGHYGRLSVSVQRLSSGLRINSAADDAAGLAIRELQRADIAALNQGMRNANDAISMLQVADGALAIIDEKLIRMKELAEQAATGTYDSTQRLLIDSEFRAMASEIDRIANATDFNGLKLLDGSLSGAHDGKGLTSKGKMKIHFGSGNDSAEDYYYVEIGDCTTLGLGLREKPLTHVDGTTGPTWFQDKNFSIDWENQKLVLDIAQRSAGPGSNSPAGIGGIGGMDYYALPAGLENVVITSDVTNDTYAHKPHVNIFTTSGKQLTGVPPDDAGRTSHKNQKQENYIWWNYADGATDTVSQTMAALKGAGLLDQNATYANLTGGAIAGAQAEADGMTVTQITGISEDRGEEIIKIDEINDNLVFIIGGHVSAINCNEYSLKIEADISDDLLAKMKGEDIEGEIPEIMKIQTQEKAQKALITIDNAIIKKDKIRAHLGALQNRLENTVANITIQSENLQAAESRISDADVAIEMTNFVRNQVLTQSAIAMLSQANSMPQMAMRLIGG